VQDLAGPALTPWESFYVIVGSSGAALTGLQFVVIALVAEWRRPRSFAEIDAFASPAIVHFGVVLLVAAVLSAPWHSLTSVAIALGIIGGAGLVYTGIVTRRILRQTGYTAVLEDWIWHCVLPSVAYGSLLVAATVLVRHTLGAMFTVAAAVLLMLFTGINIAWDTATFLVIQRDAEGGAGAKEGDSAP
jgi:hypothetical protein